MSSSADSELPTDHQLRLAEGSNEKFIGKNGIQSSAILSEIDTLSNSKDSPQKPYYGLGPAQRPPWRLAFDIKPLLHYTSVFPPLRPVGEPIHPPQQPVRKPMFSKSKDDNNQLNIKKSNIKVGTASMYSEKDSPSPPHGPQPSSSLDSFPRPKNKRNSMKNTTAENPTQSPQTKPNSSIRRKDNDEKNLFQSPQKPGKAKDNISAVGGITGKTAASPRAVRYDIILSNRFFFDGFF